MFDQEKIILASKSLSRKTLMKNAGIKFQSQDSNVDEDIIKKTFLPNGNISDLAMILAQTKAQTVSKDFPDHFVIGADQTLLFKKQVFDKPASVTEARDQLLALRANQHQLETAVCVSKNEDILWSYSETSYLTMRDFSPEFLGRYLAAEGDDVKTSVGGYKLEGLGLQLFEKIEGDYFSILGLPMLRLLAFLRDQKVIDH